MKRLSGKEAYLPLEQLDTPFRRQRIKDLGYRLEATLSDGALKIPAQAMWIDPVLLLAVMEGRELHEGKVWHHISVSHRDRQPSWNEMSMVKGHFMGDHVEAYMIHPPKERFININPKVLHWFACLDHPDGILPDFRISGVGPDGSIGL